MDANNKYNSSFQLERADCFDGDLAHWVHSASAAVLQNVRLMSQRSKQACL